MSKDIYISLSHFFEIGNMFPDFCIYLKNLYRYKEIKNILSSKDEEEFILKRQKIYFYDKDRYPFYFNDKILNNFPEYHIAFEQSTSDYIEKELEIITGNKEKRYDFLDDEKIFELFWKRLELDVDNAYTVNSFERIFREDKFLSQKGALYAAIISNKVEMLMSILHNTNYIRKTASNIIINIPLIKKYDIIDSSSIFDYRLYRNILAPFLNQLEFKSIEDKICCIVNFRNNKYFIEFIEDLNNFINYLIYTYRLIYPTAVYGILIDKIIYDIENFKRIMDIDILCLDIEHVNSYLNKLKKWQKQYCIGDAPYRFVNQSTIQNVNFYIGEVNMRDKYSAEQVGIQGPKAGKMAQITQNFNKNAENEFNYDAIIDEISLIKNYLKSQDENDENYILMGELSRLNQATIKKDDNKIIDILQKCGQQIIDISKRIGCSILATYITHKFGI